MTTNKRSSILSSKRTRGSSRITIRGTGSQKAKVTMAKANKIPPGQYRSMIISIKEVKTAAGDDAVEVIYDLTAADGSKLKMREVIPVDGWAFERFCDALIAAGLEEDDDLIAAVGITEDVDLVYPDPKGLGHFGSRRPIFNEESVADKKATDPSPRKSRPIENDDDYEDFLEDDEV